MGDQSEHRNSDQAGEAISFALGEDYPELREPVRRICEKYPGAYWRDLETRSAYPTEFVNDLTDGGFLAALIPQEYGGAGLPIRAAAAILEEINIAGCTATQCHAQMYIMGTLLRHGSEEQKQRYLPGIARGELRLQAFGVTEPTTGSDTTKLKTRAVKKGNDRYVVSGQKVWTSRALHSDLMLLLARTTPVEEVKKRSEGLSVFLVDIRELEGQGHGDPPDRRDDQSQHDGNLLRQSRSAGRQPDRRGGQGPLLHHGRHERGAHPGRLRGGRRRALVPKKAIDYANSRVVFGRSIGKNQGVQFPIARAYAELEAADMMCRRAAALFDAHAPCGADANMAKLLASEACWKAAEAAMQTHGGFSYAKEYDIERKWREVRLYQIAPVSTNLVLAYLGQHVLGMERSY